MGAGGLCRRRGDAAGRSCRGGVACEREREECSVVEPWVFSWDGCNEGWTTAWCGRCAGEPAAAGCTPPSPWTERIRVVGRRSLDMGERIWPALPLCFKPFASRVLGWAARREERWRRRLRGCDVTERGEGRCSESFRERWRGDGVWGRSNPDAGAGSGGSEAWRDLRAGSGRA